MASRALAFARSHPSPDAGYTSIVTRLQERVALADTLAVQEREGRGGEAAAAARRIEARKEMHERLLRHLSRVSSLAALSHPELAGQFTMPRANVPHGAFLIGAKSMLSAAIARQDLLVPFGLGASLIPELTAAVAEFDTMITAVHRGQKGHADGPGDLTAVTDECAALVGVLDGLMATRFNGDAENLAAWENARNPLGPFTHKLGSASAPAAERAA